MTTSQNIDYYGDTDNYIHLKFGDVRKNYNFTSELVEQYPVFTKEYAKYFSYEETAQFKNPFQIVRYVYENNIPIHFYYNFTDEPATSKDEIMDYLTSEQSYIHELK